jgi:hypothetical protein
MLVVALKQMVALVHTGAGFGLALALELVHGLCWLWNRHRCWLQCSGQVLALNRYRRCRLSRFWRWLLSRCLEQVVQALALGLVLVLALEHVLALALGLVLALDLVQALDLEQV